MIRESGVEARVLVPEVPLGAVPARYADDLVRWARATPGAPFVAERRGEGWYTVGYADALERVRRIAAGVLSAGAHADAPVTIVAENGVDNALLALACTYVGVPYAPVSVASASADANRPRLRAILDVLTPSFVYAPDPGVAQRVADTVPGLPVVRNVAELDGDPAAADAAFARVGPDSVAKILFTSGSTGLPKGVITTHRMLCANQTMIAQAFPQLREPAVLVDWLPWSHTFGGSFCFGIALRSGGTLWVDHGKPFLPLFAQTVANLRKIAPTAYFNVPRGHALVVEALQHDPALARHFFSRLRLIINAGAGWPPALRAAYVRLGQDAVGREITTQSCWGTTETAPLSTTCWGEHPADLDTIGTPVPGNAIKLAPVEDRFEIRVRGENITPGYWRDAAATAAAFDGDGYYRTGDAGDLLDPDDPSRGIVFQGRLAENFKVSSGTWVNVGALRGAVLEACAPLAEEVVVAGHDRDAIALMVFVNVAHAQRVASADNADRATLARHPAVREHIARGIAQHNARAGGTSLRIARSIILTDAPNRDEGELTDKGTVNQRRALALRADAIARLYAEPPDAEIAIHIADAVYGGGVAGGGVGGNGVSGAVQVRPSA
jgi:feruloyl-CoA synthase